MARIGIFLGALGLVLLVILVRPGDESPSSGPAPAPTPPSGSAIAPTPSLPAPATVPTPVPTPAPTPAPALPAAGSAPKTLKSQLKERLGALAPAIERCVAQAGNPKASGVAVLHFVAAPDPATGAARVEDSGVVDEGTTLGDEALLACLHRTTHSLAAFDLPADVDSIYTEWRLELSEGVAREPRVTEYSLRRETDAPLD